MEKTTRKVAYYFLHIDAATIFLLIDGIIKALWKRCSHRVHTASPLVGFWVVLGIGEVGWTGSYENWAEIWVGWE
ncbi:hypothetical protein KY290_004993 [Solanum tuberosum]|uniref:Uncharacterized protein n=1 Tax=Solanum tuberosum TaxID=4113 RepID=A0ABQ7WCU4_SOLTU|nr:hypothetical protein KY289_005356 [Solanum tuberosum]KAH0778566.1 hypothetical protein KY290_004993 [Solanum tuberosum]